MSRRNLSTRETESGTRLQRVLAVGAAAKRVHLPHSFVPVDVVKREAQLLSTVNLLQPDGFATFKPMDGGDDVGISLYVKRQGDRLDYYVALAKLSHDEKNSYYDALASYRDDDQNSIFDKVWQVPKPIPGPFEYDSQNQQPTQVTITLPLSMQKELVAALILPVQLPDANTPAHSQVPILEAEVDEVDGTMAITVPNRLKFRVWQVPS